MPAAEPCQPSVAQRSIIALQQRHALKASPASHSAACLSFAILQDTAEKRGVPWQQRVFELEHSEVGGAGV